MLRARVLDREQVEPVIDEFYALHGWDVERGWPTRERLRELGLEDVYEPMVEGAARAEGAQGLGGQAARYGGLRR